VISKQALRIQFELVSGCGTEIEMADQRLSSSPQGGVIPRCRGGQRNQSFTEKFPSHGNGNLQSSRRELERLNRELHPPVRRARRPLNGAGPPLLLDRGRGTIPTSRVGLRRKAKRGPLLPLTRSVQASSSARGDLAPVVVDELAYLGSTPTNRPDSQDAMGYCRSGLAGDACRRGIPAISRAPVFGLIYA
jgi:hypothetical protein